MRGNRCANMQLNPKIAYFLILFVASWGCGGCSLFPEKRARDQIHNPFPQMKRVAVLPFFNQSENPTVDAQAVAGQYYAELQSVPGFEVMPMGVARQGWIQFSRQFGEPQSGKQFQELARFLGVEAVVAGSITDFDAYYPPRMAMTTQWYSANEGFHPVPVGYGLPWGTEGEEHIPRRIVREAEFELARSQLATQAPPSSMGPPLGLRDIQTATEAGPGGKGGLAQASDGMVQHGDIFAEGDAQLHAAGGTCRDCADGLPVVDAMAIEAPLPAQWPSPEDLIPDPPSEVPPTLVVNHEPVLSHTRIYRGDDPAVTERLADYVETGDDARSDGWQGYLRRSDDFVRFCCYLHITEMLESRGGRDQSDLILRWPLSRY